MRRAALAFTALLALLVPSVARAGGNMEPTPERLVLQPPGLPPGQTCQSIAANPSIATSAGLKPQDLNCRPDNVAFANMISDLGFAIAPTSFYPARTTGVGGFVLSIEANYTRINADRHTDQGTQYWHLGTRGAQDSSSKVFSIVNNSPDSILQIYALKARKGLPLGFEIAGSLGYIANSPLWVGGGDVRWSVLEGFRTGALGLFPDVSVGAGVRTLMGTSKFYLTTVGIDAKVSKPIPIADSAVLTPVFGYQRVIILGDSNVVDSTPNVDPLQQCGFAGNDPNTGAPICKNKLANGADNNGDFGNNFTFNKVRVHRHRGIVGLFYKYELVWLGSQIAFDLTDPSDEQSNIVGSRQWTLSFEGGVSF
ncbi:MAG TPA: hypothetical protein VIF62_35355 [Labilithrix sp.]